MVKGSHGGQQWGCHQAGSEEAGVLAQEAGLVNGKVICSNGVWGECDVPCCWDLPKGSGTHDLLTLPLGPHYSVLWL